MCRRHCLIPLLLDAAFPFFWTLQISITVNGLFFDFHSCSLPNCKFLINKFQSECFHLVFPFMFKPLPTFSRFRFMPVSTGILHFLVGRFFGSTISTPTLTLMSSRDNKLHLPNHFLSFFLLRVLCTSLSSFTPIFNELCDRYVASRFVIRLSTTKVFTSILNISHQIAFRYRTLASQSLEAWNHYKLFGQGLCSIAWAHWENPKCITFNSLPEFLLYLFFYLVQILIYVIKISYFFSFIKSNAISAPTLPYLPRFTSPFSFPCSPPAPLQEEKVDSPFPLIKATSKSFKSHKHTKS